jgi:hypothetical protein
MKTISVRMAGARVALMTMVWGSQVMVSQIMFPQISAAQEGSSPVTREFVSGGQVKMNLESGGYDVKPSTDNRIRITWNQASAKDVKVKLITHGSVAALEVTNTPNHFQATIEVPADANLRIRLTAGALVVGHIKGNKDIESNAGDVNVAVGDANEWSKVDASVRAGNLDAPVFNVSKGGLFRSFSWSGSGKYKLEVHLLAGNLSLHR